MLCEVNQASYHISTFRTRVFSFFSFVSLLLPYKRFLELEKVFDYDKFPEFFADFPPYKAVSRTYIHPMISTLRMAGMVRLHTTGFTLGFHSRGFRQ